MFQEFAQLGLIVWFFFTKSWWIIIPFILWQAFQTLWIIYRSSDFKSRVYKPVFYEVKIPPDLEKSPKLFESMLTGFHGIQSSPNEQEIWKEGKYQSSISLEIIGRKGDIRFIIGTNTKVRDIIESQIYANYPQAEVTEVPDPFKPYPKDIITSDIDIFGSELKLEKEDAYPIKTYREYIDDVTREFNDPIVHLLETIDQLREKEEIWIQIIARPIKKTEAPWHEDGEKLINEVMGRAEKRALKAGDIAKHETSDFMSRLRQAPFQTPDEGTQLDDDDQGDLIRMLTPTEKEVVEATARNISKLGFQTKIRFAYIGPKSDFRRDFYYGIMASFKQFNSHTLNGFKNNGSLINGIDYFMIKSRTLYRTRRLWKRFRERWFLESGFVLNTEELATVYHFPDISVISPSTPRVESKTAEAPINLPIVDMEIPS